MEKRVLCLCLGLVSVFILTSCSIDKTLLDAELFDNSTPYAKQVAYYQQKAALSKGTTADSYRLMQAGRLIYQGMYDRAGQVLSSLDDLPPSLESEKNHLKAELSLKLSQPNKASVYLRRITYHDLATDVLKAHYHRVAALVYFDKQQIAKAIDERVALNPLLQNDAQRLANLRNTWARLNELPLSQINQALTDKTLSYEPSAWLSLNRLFRTDLKNSRQLRTGLKTWLKQYHNSVVTKLLPYDALTKLANFHHHPKQIALLLPLKGEYSGPGQAVRDGFMAAFYQAKTRKPTVRFYDTSSQDVMSVYRKAIDNGADFVVGPLLKRQAKAVGAFSSEVPSLLLNDSLKKKKTNIYQLAISPQEEIAEVAFKAYQDGHRRALLIAPSGEWGESIVKAFNQSWQYMGGEVVDRLIFNNKTPLDGAIKSLLRIDQSQKRYHQLKQIIGKAPEFSLRRREDFDVIFLLTYSSSAKQVRPLLRYYYAGDIPIYSSSLVYSGYPNAHEDRDLNGIKFADMPWLIDNSQLVKKRWPEQFNSYNRLFAIGQDAYFLTQHFNRLTIFPMLGLSDSSGTLYLDNIGKIHRKLTWLTFKNGVPKRLS